MAECARLIQLSTHCSILIEGIPLGVKSLTVRIGKTLHSHVMFGVYLICKIA